MADSRMNAMNGQSNGGQQARMTDLDSRQKASSKIELVKSMSQGGGATGSHGLLGQKQAQPEQEDPSPLLYQVDPQSLLHAYNNAGDALHINTQPQITSITKLKAVKSAVGASSGDILRISHGENRQMVENKDNGYSNIVVVDPYFKLRNKSVSQIGQHSGSGLIKDASRLTVGNINPVSNQSQKFNGSPMQTDKSTLLMIDSKTPSAALIQQQQLGDNNIFEKRISSVQNINRDLKHLNLYRMGSQDHNAQMILQEQNQKRAHGKKQTQLNAQHDALSQNNGRMGNQRQVTHETDNDYQDGQYPNNQHATSSIFSPIIFQEGMDKTAENLTIGANNMKFGSSISHATQFIEDLKSLKAIGGVTTIGTKTKFIDTYSGVRTHAGDFLLENPYNADQITDDMTGRDSLHQNDSCIASDRVINQRSKDSLTKRSGRMQRIKSIKVNKDVQKIFQITNMEFKKSSALCLTKKKQRSNEAFHGKKSSQFSIDQSLKKGAFLPTTTTGLPLHRPFDSSYPRLLQPETENRFKSVGGVDHHHFLQNALDSSMKRQNEAMGRGGDDEQEAEDVVVMFPDGTSSGGPRKRRGPLTGKNNQRILNIDLDDKFQRLRSRDQYNIVSESSISKDKSAISQPSHFIKSKSSQNFYTIGGKKGNPTKSETETAAARVFTNEPWFQQLAKRRNEQEQMTQRIRGTYDKMVQESEKYQSVRLTSQIANSNKEAIVGSAAVTEKLTSQKLWKNTKFMEIQEEDNHKILPTEHEKVTNVKQLQNRKENKTYRISNSLSRENIGAGQKKFDSIASVGTEQQSFNFDAKNQVQLSETNSLFQSKGKLNQNYQYESTYNALEQPPAKQKQDVRRMYYQSCQVQWEMQKKRSLTRLGLISSIQQKDDGIKRQILPNPDVQSIFDSIKSVRQNSQSVIEKQAIEGLKIKNNRENRRDLKFFKRPQTQILNFEGKQNDFAVTDYEDEEQIQRLLDENQMAISSTRLRGSRLVQRNKNVETERSEGEDSQTEVEYEQQVAENQDYGYSEQNQIAKKIDFQTDVNQMQKVDENYGTVQITENQVKNQAENGSNLQQEPKLNSERTSTNNKDEKSSTEIGKPKQTINQQTIKIAQSPAVKSPMINTNSQSAFKRKMTEYFEEQTRQQLQMIQERQNFKKLKPLEKAQLERHCRMLVDDLEKSRFLSDKQYIDIKLQFTDSLNRYIAISQNEITPYIKKMQFAGQKNPLRNTHFLTEENRMNVLIKRPDLSRIMVEKCAKQFIDFLRENKDLLKQKSLGVSRMQILTMIEKTLIQAYFANGDQRVLAEKAKKEKQAQGFLREPYVDPRSLEDTAREYQELKEAVHATRRQDISDLRIESPEQSEDEFAEIEQPMELRRQRFKGRHLQAIDGKIFQFQEHLDQQERIDFIIHQTEGKVLTPCIERKLIYLNLFNNSKKDILAQLVAQDPRLRKVNSSNVIMNLPYNNSGIQDIFMTREKTDLDVWQQEELIMDQLKENCTLVNDQQLFQKMYQKEIQRRAHSFYMRKQVKIAGRNLEEVKKGIQKYKKKIDKDDKNGEIQLENEQQIENKDELEQSKNKVIYQEQKEFYEVIKKNNWIAVMVMLRSNRNFGHGGDEIGNSRTALTTLVGNKLEWANGIDLLNCKDIKGRLPIDIAYKYKAMDVVSVLLHLGADHCTNSEAKQMTSNYIHNALKGRLFGLNKLQGNNAMLAANQLLQLNQTVYPKLDLKVMRLIEFIMRSPDLSRAKSTNRRLESGNAKLMKKFEKGFLGRMQNSFSLDAMKDMNLSLNEYAELRKFTIDLIVSGKMEEFVEAMGIWREANDLKLKTQTTDHLLADSKPASGTADH